MSARVTHRRKVGGTVWEPATACGRTVDSSRIATGAFPPTCKRCKRHESHD